MDMDNLTSDTIGIRTENQTVIKVKADCISGGCINCSKRDDGYCRGGYQDPRIGKIDKEKAERRLAKKKIENSKSKKRVNACRKEKGEKSYRQQAKEAGISYQAFLYRKNRQEILAKRKADYKPKRPVITPEILEERRLKKNAYAVKRYQKLKAERESKMPKKKVLTEEEKAERDKETRQKYYQRTKDKRAEYRKEYNEKNKEKIKAYQRAYRENNREKMNLLQKNYQLRKKMKDGIE